MNGQRFHQQKRIEMKTEQCERSLNSLCLAFHSADKGSLLTMGLKHRQRCRVQILIFLVLQFQKGPKQRTYLPYLARAVSCGLFAHDEEYAQSLMVSRGSLKLTRKV